MKYIVLILLFILPGKALAEENLVLSDVSELSWQNRVLLIFSDDSVNDLRQLMTAENELAERHVVWFVIEGDGVISNYQGILADDFVQKTEQSFAKGQQAVFLVGKDGGIKRKNDALDLDSLFKLIDTMPMRKQEMTSK